MSTTIEKSPIGEQDLNRWAGTSSETFTRETSAGYDITMRKIGAAVDVVMSYGGGVNFDRAAIAAALTAIGATNKVGLVLRPGTWTIDADLTITSNITLMPAPGCKFTVATGKTATIQGPVMAGPYQWIYGTGTTTISTYPQDQVWWGSTQRTDFAKINWTLGSDANGDIYYRASGVITRLAKGTAGQVLKMNSGATAPEWSTEEGKQVLRLGNLSLAATVGSKALTVALKGEDGNDPSASNVVTIAFRDETLTTGTPNIRTVTGALSVVLSSGSTLGFTAAEAGRLYVWAIDNAGTVELALSRTADIFPEGNLVTTTAEGGAGAADSAAVMYSTTARTDVACRCIGYVEITTGGTAGEWDNAPTKIQIMGPGVRRTGDIVQIVSTQTGAVATGSTAMPIDDTIPQKTEGDEYMTKAITPSSAVNRLLIETITHISNASYVNLAAALFKDDTANALAAVIGCPGAQAKILSLPITHYMVAGTTSETTFKIRAGCSDGGTTTFNGSGGGRLYGGVMASFIRITEVFA